MDKRRSNHPDLVYVIGPGGHESQTELVYSLRSMAAHLKNFRQLIIVGSLPDGVQPDIFFPFEDPHPGNPDRNIYEKIMGAAGLQEVSETFVVCSDDYILLRDYDARTFPYYYSDTLQHSFGQYVPTNYYQKNIAATMDVLAELGLPQLNFNVHAPIRYNKEDLVRVSEIFAPYWSDRVGLLWKSLYCNTLKIRGRRLDDCKIGVPKTPGALRRALTDRPWFSTSELAMNSAMLSLLQEHFPDPSRFEKGKK